jgi:hypothetical protein
MSSNQLFERYQEAYPNANAVYDPTPGNVRKWANALEAKQRIGNLARYEREYKGIEQLRSERGAVTYEGMAQNARQMYQRVKECYIGVPVYACGSRVRGDYVDMWNAPGDGVRSARIEAGMPDKKESDFDYWLSGEYETNANVPPVCDRVRCVVPNSEKIMLPEWDFTLLPENEHERVLELITNEMWGELLRIHDQYKLSPYTYCCDLEGFKKWWRHGIETNKISGVQDNTTAEN